MAGFQFWIGIVHFAEILCSARYNSFNTDSSVGNTRRVFVILRSEPFSNSIALVVYIALRISGAKSKMTISRSQLFRQDWLMVGYLYIPSGGESLQRVLCCLQISRIVNSADLRPQLYALSSQHNAVSAEPCAPDIAAPASADKQLQWLQESL